MLVFDLPKGQVGGSASFDGGFTYTNKNLQDMTPDEYNQYLAKSRETRGRQNELWGNTGIINEKKSGTGSNTSSSTGLFGGLDGLTSSTGYKNLIDQAKDMARFRLGLDKDQAEFSYGLRDKEAEGNFGRQFKLDTQNRQFDRDINTDTQSALTQRLEKELANRLEQQQTGINQENFATNRAIRLASKRLGG